MFHARKEISAAQGIAVRKMCAPEARLEFVYRLRMLNPPPERGRQGMKRSLGPGTSDVWVLTFVLLHMKLFLRMGSEGPMRGSSATHGAPCLEDLTGVSRSWAYRTSTGTCQGSLNQNSPLSGSILSSLSYTATPSRARPCCN